MRFDQFFTSNASPWLASPSGLWIALRWFFRLAFPAFVIAILSEPDGLQLLDRAALVVAPVSWLMLERLSHRAHGIRLSTEGLTLMPSGRTIPADRITNIEMSRAPWDAHGTLRLTLSKPMYLVEAGGAFAFGTTLTVPFLKGDDAPSRAGRRQMVGGSA